MLVADLPAIMKKVFEKQPSLAFLREARALSCDNDRLLLGLPSEFLVERARELRPQVQALLREDLGPALSLEFVQDKTAAEEAAQRESLAVAEERARTAEMTKRRREAVEHQSVKLVREVFGEVSFQEPELENG